MALELHTERCLTSPQLLFPLHKANAAHEAQAFIIYEKFIIGPVCGVEQGSAASEPLSRADKRLGQQ